MDELKIIYGILGGTGGGVLAVVFKLVFDKIKNGKNGNGNELKHLREELKKDIEISYLKIENKITELETNFITKAELRDAIRGLK